MFVLDKMQHFGLCATGAVNHTVYFPTHIVQELFDNRCVSPGRRQYKLTCC